MDQKKKHPTDPQIIVVLRAVGGAYLLYLAWGLRQAALSSPLYLLAAVAFALVGAALLFFSVRQLYRRDFLYPGQSPEDFDEDVPDGEEEDGSEAEDGGRRE